MIERILFCLAVLIWLFLYAMYNNNYTYYCIVTLLLGISFELRKKL